MQQTRYQMKALTLSLKSQSPKNSLSQSSIKYALDEQLAFFGRMRSGKEQRDLCWGDFQLKTDSEGNRLIEFNIERQTKTRTGENPRNIREKKPKMYGDESNADRCPSTPIWLTKSINTQA